MTFVIGLTGSIASGKSTVSLMFDEFNIPVIDADKVAREVVRPGEPAYKGIIQNFGEEILRDDLTLDRKALGQIVFHDDAKLKMLNSIVHPEIRKEMIQQRDALIRSGEKAIVLDIPLLFESKLESLVDQTIVVYVDEAVQLQRLMEREGFSEVEAKRRIDVQMSLSKKKKLADVIIDNNGTKYQTFEQLDRILRNWQIV